MAEFQAQRGGRGTYPGAPARYVVSRHGSHRNWVMYLAMKTLAVNPADSNLADRRGDLVAWVDDRDRDEWGRYYRVSTFAAEDATALVLALEDAVNGDELRITQAEFSPGGRAV